MNTQAISWTRGHAGRYAATALGAVVLALGAFTPVAAQAAAPTTLYVSQGGLDSGTCTSASPCATVSFALTKAAPHATIKVSGTIDDHLTITHPVTITTWPGGPARSAAVLDGTASGTVVTVNPGVAGVTLHDLTIENGTESGTFAGGIQNWGNLTLTDSTVSGNSDGGIDSGVNVDDNIMTIVDSTISGNTGVGIVNFATTTIIASTISGNTNGGINIVDQSGAPTITLGATIVADNSGYNCLGSAASLVSAGYNLTNDKTGKACEFTAATDRVNKKPLLGHLAKNGGPTKTLLPAAGGPADDVISKTTTLRGVPVCAGTDQRGVARPGPGDTRCTVGAVEV
jgi:hypothetical protein